MSTMLLRSLLSCSSVSSLRWHTCFSGGERAKSKKLGDKQARKVFVFFFHSQLTERMSTVLVIAQILRLRAVVGLIASPLLLIQLKSSAAAVVFLPDTEIFKYSAGSFCVNIYKLTSQVEYVLIFTILEFLGSWKIFCFLSRIF
jgi:hypothetical protein